MKIIPLGAELFRADGRTDRQTDRHDEANSTFSQFCESAYRFTFHLQSVFMCFVGMPEQTAIISQYRIGFCNPGRLRLLSSLLLGKASRDHSE